MVMINFKRLMIVLLAFGMGGCAVSPTGRQQLTMLSASQLDSLGAQSFAELKRSKPIETDPQINTLVRCVAQAIVRESRAPGPWEVLVFRDRSANAFALPG